MKVIFQNDNGGISIIHPTDEALEIMSIDEIAQKDVPTGLPYKIVDDSEVPTDQTYRDWETDRKSTRLNSSHLKLSRMPSSA